MEKAVMVDHGQETLISASEVQSKFFGRIPADVKFNCPLCGQPLVASAMGANKKETPHFRHKTTTSGSRECENYARAGGTFSTYQRAPMPLFIRRSRSEEGRFVVEAGLRHIEESSLWKLKEEGAVLHLGTEAYNITLNRFNNGMTKLPFREISLDVRSLVSLTNSSLSLSTTWGHPESSDTMLVFTRDPYSEQGRSIKSGDSIPLESCLYLLVPDLDQKKVLRYFPGAKKAGIAGSDSIRFQLSVFEARVSHDEEGWEESVAFLRECGYKVVSTETAPSLIWPPSLTSSGDCMPLFKESKCIFTVEKKASPEGKLYIHTNTDTAERVRTARLRTAEDKEHSLAIFQNANRLSFIANRNWTLSALMLLYPNLENIEKHLTRNDITPDLLTAPDGRQKLLLKTPATIRRFDKGRPSSAVQIESSRKAVVDIPKQRNGLLRITTKVGAPTDELLIYEHRPKAGKNDAPRKDRAKVPSRRMVVNRYEPDDVRRARTRNANNGKRAGLSSDKIFAADREASR